MKTKVIYNIGKLIGILPADVRMLAGEAMGHVECIDNAYLVIEDGIIADFGSMTDLNPEYVSGRGDSGIQNRATPLAAGGGARANGVGGVVLTTNAPAVNTTYFFLT